MKGAVRGGRIAVEREGARPPRRGDGRVPRRCSHTSDRDRDV